MIAGISLEVLDSVAQWISYWFQRFPWVGTFLCFTILDAISGTMAAFKTKEASSSVGFGGMFKKAGMMIALLAVALLNKANPQIPGVEIIAAFFAGNEGISITENLAKLGVPLPQGLIDSLAKLREFRGSKKDIPVLEHTTSNTIVVVTKEEPNVGTDQRAERRQNDKTTGANNGFGDI